ncbi:SRPBCC domain-containing protein [Chitinophaga niabensis]|uniref:Uncharacterized conserved protein YndB, AHSA1/START domain n=1 Tax=Chitinophaga niabensis TaxID=536979 RepID=A0A1N6FM27_9BACT|nr:SRPBCC domain-containing protein [Chitinophaga niabensis]SIN96312.1 Uncharacterized conserved protein YndB, AHSA1/START domain [Chitinophaga niabensis]
MAEKNKSFRQEGNALIHTRLLNAPRELVWEVWTEPEHIKEWWGPNGFTLTHRNMEVKEGKAWDFIMHGMGRDWDNKIEYLEVVKPSLLRYRHGDGGGGLSFTVSVTFEEADGKTLLTMRSVFESEEVIAVLNKQVNAIEGGKQTLDRMGEYVERQYEIRKDS